MRQGAEGAWLFHLPYTPEPHSATFFYVFHVLLGKLAALVSWGDLTRGLVWTYHGARLIFGMGLLFTVYRFLAAFTERVMVRRLAWLMVTFGGGLGWLLVVLGQPGWLGSMPLDFILPEGFTFLILYGFPHIALARTLLLWGTLFLLRAWGQNSKRHVPDHRWAALAGFLWLLMGVIVPFYVLVAWAIMGGMGIALTVRERRIPWRKAALAILAGLCAVPPVAYTAWVTANDPVYSIWASQLLMPSPHPLHYLVAFGPSLLFASLAVPRVWRGRGPGWAALTWVIIAPLLVYLPFSAQRRLVEGVQVPLNLLAAWGVSGLKWRGFRLRVLVGVLLVGLSLTNVMLVLGNCLALRERPDPIYRDAGEVAALDWLGERAEFDDVVLAAYESGNYLPARAQARPFVGHGPESIRADEKKALAAQFFAATTDDVWRRDLVAEYGVDWVFWGPWERALGTFDPHAAPYLQPVYEAGSYTIFQVDE
jgi:hypothetical protein